MREGWNSTTLKNVCAIEKAKHDGKALSYVGLEHIESKTGQYLGDFVPIAVKSSTFRFTPEHVLFGRLRPYLNKVLLPEFDGHCSSEIFPLRVKSALNRRFLYYWLTWEPVVKKIDNTSTGARMPRANVSKVLEFELPLPPLPEQKRIVAILDEAFAGIAMAVANTEKNRANARELFESFLNSVFSQRGEGWTECLLSEVCDFENGDRGKNYPNKSVLVARGRPFVNAGHLSEGKVCLDKMSYIPEDRYQILANGKFSPGDILFCLRGSLGKFGVVGPDVGNGAIASSLVIVRPKVNGKNAPVQREFLLHYFRSSLCAEMIERFSGGAAQPNLGARDLAKFEINVPPIDEQRNLSARLDEYFECTKYLEKVIGRKLTALAELKQSLLRKAFSGELTAGKEAPDEILKDEEVA